MNKLSKTLFTFAYGFIILFIIIMSTVPPVSRDSQTHHLALPKIWLSEGLLSEVPDMEFSYYPQLIDLFYILPVALDVDIIAKYIHFAFGLGTMLLIFLYLRRFLGVFWGLMGGLMFLSLPIILKLSVTVYVDLGLLFFFTASLFSILIWLEDPKKVRWIIISGICSGLAMSTKYNAMLSVTLLTLLFSYFFLKMSNKKIVGQLNTIKYMAIFSLCALLIYSPWLVRNYSLTGNPIYPLHQSFFSKINSNHESKNKLEQYETKKLSPLSIRKIVFNESLPYSLAVPFRIFFEGQDNKPQYFDGKLNPLLLLFPFLLIFMKRKSWQNRFFASFVILTLLYTTLAVDMRIRYVITIVSPMIILSVFGLFELNQWLNTKFPKSRTPFFILTPLILAYFIYNMSYGFTLFKNINPIPYLSGKISREEYISNKLPYYSLNKIANKVVPSNGKLLGIYTGNRRYYINVPLSLESTLPFVLAKNASNASELSQEFSKRNITHLLVRVDLFNQELSRKETKIQNIITQFFNSSVKLIDFNGAFFLYKIDAKVLK
jgi:hypothetical protein